MPCGCRAARHLNLPRALLTIDFDRSAMDILYLLIPLSVVLVFFILGGLWWAIHRGQFEDVEREGERILRDP